MPNPRDFNDIMKEYLNQKNEKSPSKPVKQKLSLKQTESLNKRLDNLMPQFKKAICFTGCLILLYFFLINDLFVLLLPNKFSCCR